jgi:hypothetical protein
MILSFLTVVALNTNVVNQASPSTQIYCPVFMTMGQAIFGKPGTPPKAHNKILQRAMCFNQVVKPLQDFCILAGYEEKKCKARTLSWINASKKRRGQ